WIASSRCRASCNPVMVVWIWAVSAAICDCSAPAAERVAEIWLWRSPALEGVRRLPSSTAAIMAVAASERMILGWVLNVGMVICGKRRGGGHGVAADGSLG